MSVSLYPLTFVTIFKEKLWGGQKIRTILNKDFAPLANCGETWEISGVKGNESVVKNGGLAGMSLPNLIQEYREELLGKSIYNRFGHEFPLLVKFIDANQDLSIQVHPDDELAKKRHNSFGKTEMWYIFQADEDAKLISGFNQPIDKETYLKHFESGKLTDILNKEAVHEDDVFFLPAGRVHTIGKGILLAEIQQTSDITYRIYDFDRVDANGKKRELHVEEALDAIDYTFHDEYKTLYEKKENEVVEMVKSPYFTTNRMHFSNTVTRNYADLDSFVIYVCMEGACNLAYEGGQQKIQKGDAILIPASIKETTLNPEGSFKMLESYIEIV